MTQHDDRAPEPVEPQDGLASTDGEPILGGVDSGEIASLLARMPEHAREEAREHWAGRSRAERRAEPNQATPEDWQEVYAAQAARRAAVWRESVPREYADAHVSKLDADQHPVKLFSWWSGGARILYLRSSIPGNGKTYAAYAVANAVCDKVRCSATTLADLVTGQLASREHVGISWKTATQCDLLILDDLGQESGVGWEQEKARELLHRLLSIRASEGRRTIITTNRDGKWVEAGYGSAIADRLVDEAAVIEFTGPSRRQPVDWGELG